MAEKCAIPKVTRNLNVVYRYEVDKLTASQRLDLNLEKGRMRDELQVWEAVPGEEGMVGGA